MRYLTILATLLFILIATALSTACQPNIVEVNTVERVVTRVVERPVERTVTEVVEQIVEVNVVTEVEVTRIVAADSLPKPTDITIWVEAADAASFAQYDAIAAAYKADNPLVQITFVPMSSSVLFDQLEAARLANRLPDLIQLGLDDALMVSAETIVDRERTSDLIASYGEQRFKSALLDQTRLGSGQHAAIPFYASGFSLWYRTDYANLAGRGSPLNWNDVSVRSDALTSRDLTRFGIALPTDPTDPRTADVFEHIAHSVGAKPFDANGNLRFDAPEFAAALAWVANLNASAVPGTLNGSEARAAFTEGRATLLVDDPSFIAQAIDGQQFGRIDSFYADGELTNTYGTLSTFIITQQADSEALAVMRYLLDDAYLDMLGTNLLGQLPVLVSAEAGWKNRALVETGLSNDMLDKMLDSSSTIRNWRMDPMLTTVQRTVLADLSREQLIGQVIYAVADQRTLTPLQGAQFLQEQAQALLSLRANN